jgi:hypothetical protein
VEFCSHATISDPSISRRPARRPARQLMAALRPPPACRSGCRPRAGWRRSARSSSDRHRAVAQSAASCRVGCKGRLRVRIPGVGNRRAGPRHPAAREIPPLDHEAGATRPESRSGSRCPRGPSASSAASWLLFTLA